MWGHGANELFYLGLERAFVAVQFETAPQFVVVQSRTLFTVPVGVQLLGGTNVYDISPDDQRFLMRRLFTVFAGSAGSNFVLTQNWFAELRRLVPN